MKTRIILCFLIFNATLVSAQVADIDGNIYKTVIIGEQEWMAENLKTTHYRDGTPIEYPGDDDQAWLANKTGAFAWYQNDIKWKEPYGTLYNQYAVNNEAGLCPEGWRVPEPGDWNALQRTVRNGVHINFAFPDGNKLKSCRQRNSPLGEDCNTSEHPRWHGSRDHHGTDDFGFGALPGGMRSDFSGRFANLGANAYFWAKSTNTWVLEISDVVSGVKISINHDPETGASVRCVKNTP